jgi:WD40 repeat protein
MTFRCDPLKRLTLIGLFWAATGPVVAADEGPTAVLVPSTGHPNLIRKVELDLVNDLVISSDPSSPTIVTERATGRELLTLPQLTLSQGDYVLEPVPGRRGLFVSSYQDPNTLRVGSLIPSATDWGVAAKSGPWRAADAVSVHQILAVDFQGLYSIDIERREVLPIPGLEHCPRRSALIAIQRGPSPSYVACVSDFAPRTIKVLELTEGHHSRLLNVQRTMAKLSISADGRYLVALCAGPQGGKNTEIRVWDLSKDAPEPVVMEDQTAGFEDFALEDGAELGLVTTSGFSGKLRRWHCTAGAASLNCQGVVEINTAGQQVRCYGLALSSQAQQVYAGCGRDIIVFDLTSLQLIKRFPVMTVARIQKIGFWGTQGFFANGFDDVTLKATIVLQVPSPDRIDAFYIPFEQLLRPKERPPRVVVGASQDGQRIVEQVRFAQSQVINALTGQVLGEFHGSDPEFSRSGNIVAYTHVGIAPDGVSVCAIEVGTRLSEPVCIPMPANGTLSPKIAVSEYQIATADMGRRPDGSFDMAVRIWDRKTGAMSAVLERKTGWVKSLQFSSDSTRLLVAGSDLTEWRAFPAQAAGLEYTYDASEVTFARYGAGDTRVFWGNSKGRIAAFNRGQKAILREFVGQSGDVEALEVGDASAEMTRHLLLSGGLDGAVRGWDLQACEKQTRGRECQPLFTLFHTEATHWCVVTGRGQFDTNDFDSLRGLSWVVSDDSLKALPLEIFTREYFEPGLLGRLLRGESFSEQRSVAELNRAQPEVGPIVARPVTP